MESFHYDLTTLYVIGIDLIVAVLMLTLLHKGGASTQTKWTFGLGSVLWIGFLDWVFRGKHIFPEDMSGPVFYGIILVSAVAVLVLFYLSPIKQAFDNLSQVDIQLTQGWRVFVAAGFMVEGSWQVIPANFGILDGYLHITSAFLALTAAVLLSQKAPKAKSVLWSANIIGTLDPLIIVTGICFFVWEAMGPHHNMMYVVLYAAPIVLWLHFTSVRKLILEQNEELHFSLQEEVQA